MRFSFVGSVMIVLALAGLAPSSAAAQNDTVVVVVFLQSLAPTRAAGA